jgi:hypothetical protein
MEDAMRIGRGRLILGFLILALTTIAHPALADMIGDSLTIRRLYPDLATEFAPSVNTTVQAGAGDAVSPQATLYLINPEANTILFDFIATSGFGGEADNTPFDGLQFLGFNEPIQNVSIVQEIGIDIVGLAFDLDFINLNLNGVFTADSVITLSVTFATQQEQVPAPGALALLGVALVTLGLMRRRTTPR